MTPIKEKHRLSKKSGRSEGRTRPGLLQPDDNKENQPPANHLEDDIDMPLALPLESPEPVMEEDPIQIHELPSSPTVTPPPSPPIEGYPIGNLPILYSPEAIYRISLSTSVTIECFARELENRIESGVYITDSASVASLFLTHEQFDQLLVISTFVNHAVGLVHAGIAVRTVVDLGEGTTISVKSRYALIPIDIRRWDRVGDDQIASADGVFLTGSEWRVMYTILPLLHSRLCDVERDVQFVLDRLIRHN